MSNNGCDSSRVALLIPAYNCQAYLNASVAGLPTEEPLHVLIVDDGSTPPLVAPPCDPIHSVEILRNPVNLKIHGALRRGMEVLHARGFGYVARLDAGDFALPGRFRLQRAFLDAHPGVALVGSSIELLAVPGGLGTVRLPESDAVIRCFKLLKMAFSHPAVMMRADAVVAIGNYRDSHPCAEDLDLFLRLMKRYEVANLPQVLTRKIEHRACITVRRRRQMILSTMRLQLAYLRPGSWADWAGLAKSISQLTMPRSAFERMKLWVVHRPDAAHDTR